MKYIKNKSVLVLSSVFILGILISSCEDFLDKNPVKELTPSEYYQNEDDANAAVRGIYGKLAYLAPKILILNELSADLMDVTQNADEYYKQINRHEADINNPYVDATEFYELINNCNDALYNFNIMRKELRITEDAYLQRYSDIAALRSWLYLNVVVLYGKVPYITEPLNSVDDINKVSDTMNYPYLDVNDMVDSLYNFMGTITFYDKYTDENLTTDVAGHNADLYYISKYILMGDLCLWKGDYYNAAMLYKFVMNDYGFGDLFKYKVGVWAYKDMYYQSGYERYYENDIHSEINTWPDMFSSMSSSNNYFLNEWIWVIFYDDIYEPYNPFFDYFSNTIGNYYFKPSTPIMNEWKVQERHNSFIGDFRGEDGSYKIINGEPVITKLISMYDELNPNNRQGKWGISRATGVHLRYAEATNRYALSQNPDSAYIYPKIAFSLVNNGVYQTFHNPDTTNLALDGFTPFNDYAFYMDGRAIDVPYTVRGLFCRNGGIRGRVYLKDKSSFVDSIAKVTDINELVTNMEDDIIDEAALELAYEGNRWHDLVRIALRRDDPLFLATKVAAKFGADSAAVCDRLKIKENWFLPFK